MSSVTATPGVKLQYLIRRKPTTSREELVANWFANHMPAVIAGQQRAAEAGRLHARRYIATLFDPGRDGQHVWDGVAQLWWDEAPPAPAEPHGTNPTDTFQQKAEPYTPWATREYVAIDGALPLQPNTLNPPFPCTRSGFFKVVFLVAAHPGIDHAEFYAHWLDVHRPNVAGVMAQVGGLRYVINHSVDPANAPYAGMAELWFDDAEGWRRYRETIRPDGMERWASDEGTVVLRAQTEMVGIA